MRGRAGSGKPRQVTQLSLVAAAVFATMLVFPAQEEAGRTCTLLVRVAKYDGTGLGPPVAQDLTTAQRNLGAFRATVALRYTKP